MGLDSLIAKTAQNLVKSVTALALMAAVTLATGNVEAKKRYLVQFKSEQGFKAMENYFAMESNDQDMEKSLDEVKVIVLNTENSELVKSLENHPEIAFIEPEFFFPSPAPVNGYKMSKKEVFVRKLCKNKEYKKRHYRSCTEYDFNKGEETPYGILAVRAGKAWELAKAGKRARVLVLDTGIDNEHPSIKANFEKGKNFIEGDNGEIDESDFLDREGHGTHVSGTIAGVYNKKNGFTGVSPRSKLLMGRVCGEKGCSSVAIVEGINWGIKEKVDVISMSLGGPFASQTQLTAVTNADKAGIVVVAATGNGAAEPTYSPDRKDPKCGLDDNPFMPNRCGVSYPAAFPTVIAVGAVNDKNEKTNFSQWGPELDIVAPGAAVVSAIPRGTGRESKVELIVNGKKKSVKSTSFAGTELFSNPVVNELVVVPGFGKPEDFASINIEGKFALISRGEIKFADKVKNAIAAKAAGVMIYNNTAGLMQGTLSEDGSTISYPVVMVEQTTGQELVASLTKGTAVKASILVSASNFAAFDGTSMATPHVAGVVALMKSANPRLKPARVRHILTTTAKKLKPNDTNQYGAGLIQADKAVNKALGL